MGRQAVAFLPNEIWIHEHDSITWTFNSGDIHTVTFLKAGQPLPAFTTGCPGFSASGASFDGSTCISTPPTVKRGSFAVTFPEPGNFKLVCLVHPHMTGVIHVLETSAILPHDRAFYNEEAERQKHALCILYHSTNNEAGSSDSPSLAGPCCQGSSWPARSSRRRSLLRGLRSRQ